jgi:Uma2 family endonuclease
MAETDDHRDLMLALIETLKLFYLASTQVYVSGNLLIYYVPGNKRRHVSPDVFVVRGISKHNRDYYLVWEEGKAPEVVIELTSRSTKKEDLGRKFMLYQDVLKVREYFLFDPHREYLQPPLQGYRLHKGQYVPIKPVAGRLPSKVLGLDLQANGGEVRLYDPATKQWVPTPKEAQQQAEAAQQQAEAARQQAEAAQQQAEAARQQAEAENERLRQELEVLRRRLPRES